MFSESGDKSGRRGESRARLSSQVVSRKTAELPVTPLQIPSLSAKQQGSSQTIPETSMCAAYVEQGRHTPGLCLDRVVMAGMTEILRTRHGLKALLLDGTTGFDGRALTGEEPGLTREAIVGGFFVEHTPIIFRKHLDQILNINEDILALTCAPSCFEPRVLGVRDWIANSFVNKEVGEVYKTVCSSNTKPGVNLAASILAVKNGWIERNRRFVEIGSGNEIPVRERMKYHRGFFRRGVLSTAKVDKISREISQGLNPVTALNLLHHPSKIQAALLIGLAMKRSTEELFEKAKEHFGRRLQWGGAVIAGICKLKSGDVALFASADSRVGALIDGKIYYLSQPEHPANSGSFVGVRDSGIIVKGERVIQPASAGGLQIMVIKRSIAKRALFFATSDGYENGVHDEHYSVTKTYIRALEGSQSASELVQRMKKVGVRNDSYTLKKFGKDCVNPDDKSVMAIAGRLLY